MVDAYIGLGSNLGDRAEFIRRAVERLSSDTALRVVRVSSLIETDPVGGPPGQCRYLNAAAHVQTDLAARQLLERLLSEERDLGRVRTEPNAPRTIDLDLLLYGDAVLNEPGLVVPHPRMADRLFVLRPLAEIAPDAVHPVAGDTIARLLARAESPLKQGTENVAEELAPLSFDLTNLRGMVTGSTRGIGLAIARALAAAGASVIIHGRESHRAATVASELQRQGLRAESAAADFSRAGAATELVNDAWQRWGPLDFWVHNAGADILTGPELHWDFDRKLRLLWSVDVESAINACRAVGSRMKQRGTGVIVTMGWDGADDGMAGDTPQAFAAAKGAVMAFTRCLALDLAPEVRVNCVAPGWIRTAWGRQASAPWQRRVLAEIPLGRWGTPEDVAAAVRWLVSPTAAFVTGQILRVNGGAVR